MQAKSAQDAAHSAKTADNCPSHNSFLHAPPAHCNAMITLYCLAPDPATLCAHTKLHCQRGGCLHPNPENGEESFFSSHHDYVSSMCLELQRPNEWAYSFLWKFLERSIEIQNTMCKAMAEGMPGSHKKYKRLIWVFPSQGLAGPRTLVSIFIALHW